MEHGYPKPMPAPMPAPVVTQPIVTPPPVYTAPTVSPHVNVYDIHQTKNVYDLHMAPPVAAAPVVAPVVRYNDTAMILVLFILLVIITRSRWIGAKC